VIEELSCVRTGVDDPYRFICEHGGQQALQPHQNMVIAQAAELACSIPITGT
jgi:hypothetical protein